MRACVKPLYNPFLLKKKKKEKSLSTKSKGHHLLWQERLVTCFRSEFLRKDRKSELPSLICFLSRLNQEFLNRNRKIHPPAHFNRCSQERPQPREHINTAVTVWTFVCFCLNMDRHLSKGHPKAHGFLHQSAVLWIFIYDWNIWHVTTYFHLKWMWPYSTILIGFHVQVKLIKSVKWQTCPYYGQPAKSVYFQYTFRDMMDVWTPWKRFVRFVVV